jgi:hypothetical protein
MATLFVSEHHEIFAEQAHGLYGAIAAEFIDQRRRLPIASQQLACGFAGANSRDPIVLFRTEHDELRIAGRGSSIV